MGQANQTDDERVEDTGGGGGCSGQGQRRMWLCNGQRIEGIEKDGGNRESIDPPPRSKISPLGQKENPRNAEPIPEDHLTNRNTANVR